jgi:hypothetical protein
MAGLEVEYSKQIARELTLIAVCLPGAPVSCGDIITFPHGQSGIWPFRKPAPYGSFTPISSLSNLGVAVETSEPDTDSDPYIFASRRVVDVAFDLSGTVGTPDQPSTGSMKVTFNKEGSVYFAAVGCETVHLTDLSRVQIDLGQHKHDVIWKDTFLVTSVTIAERALIMQSSTSSAQLEIGGAVSGLMAGTGNDVSADLEISITSVKEASLIKPWSTNVSVFMGLHRFRKETFGYKPTHPISRFTALGKVEAAATAGELVSSDADRYILEPVSALEMLNEADFAESER